MVLRCSYVTRYQRCESWNENIWRDSSSPQL